jgi:hypothetical protein
VLDFIYFLLGRIFVCTTRKSGANARAIWAPRPAELAVMRATFVAAIVVMYVNSRSWKDGKKNCTSCVNLCFKDATSTYIHAGWKRGVNHERNSSVNPSTLYLRGTGLSLCVTRASA